MNQQIDEAEAKKEMLYEHQKEQEFLQNNPDYNEHVENAS